MKLLTPLEKFYHLLSGIRNYVYDSGLAKKVTLPVPVVSVGNISFGGVGKTPCIIMLAEALSKKFNIAIVCRSYKASATRPQQVDILLFKAAEIFGDEACLLQKNLPQCAVWSGPVKWKTALASLASKPELILVDDGFSHRKLARNFDLLLVDASVGLDTYLRESAAQVNRAQAVLLTKTNLADYKPLEKLFKGCYKATSVSKLDILPQEPLFVYCGLANPDSLFRDLQHQGFKILEKKLFEDHHMYSDADQQVLLAQFEELQKSTPTLRLVTTEKDFTKITNPKLRELSVVVQHKMEMRTDEREALLAQIRKAL